MDCIQTGRQAAKHMTQLGLPLICATVFATRLLSQLYVTKSCCSQSASSQTPTIQDSPTKLSKNNANKVATAARCESSSILPATRVNDNRTNWEVNGPAQFFGKIWKMGSFALCRAGESTGPRLPPFVRTVASLTVATYRVLPASASTLAALAAQLLMRRFSRRNPGTNLSFAWP